jgi:hypothetical protein
MVVSESFLALAGRTLVADEGDRALGIAALADHLEDNGHGDASRRLRVSFKNPDLVIALPVAQRKRELSPVGGFYRGTLLPVGNPAQFSLPVEQPFRRAFGAMVISDSSSFARSSLYFLRASTLFRPRHVMIDHDRFNDDLLLEMGACGAFTHVRSLVVKKSMIWYHRPFVRFPVFAELESLDFRSNLLNFSGVERVIHQPIFRNLRRFRLRRGFLFPKPFVPALVKSRAMRTLEDLDIDISMLDRADIKKLSGWAVLERLGRFGITLGRECSGLALDPVARRLSRVRSVSVRAHPGCTGVVRILQARGVLARLKSLHLARVVLDAGEIEELAGHIAGGELRKLSLDGCVIPDHPALAISRLVPNLEGFRFSPSGFDKGFRAGVCQALRHGSTSLARLAGPDAEPETMHPGLFPRLARLEIPSTSPLRFIRKNFQGSGLEILNGKMV